LKKLLAENAKNKAFLRVATFVADPESHSRALGTALTGFQLEGADYARGYIQHWLSRGSGSNAEVIPEKSAQKIFRAADQIIRAGRTELIRSRHNHLLRTSRASRVQYHSAGLFFGRRNAPLAQLS
jgi:hypothetical protein